VILVVIVVVIVPIAIGVPAMVICVPPTVLAVPATLALHRQFIPPVIGLLAVGAMMLNGLV
jgi:hypothetical protein